MKKAVIFLIGSFAVVLIFVAFSRSSALPDLVVENIKVDASALNKNKTVKIKYTVKNQGKTTAGKSIAFLDIASNPTKDLHQSIKQSIPSLPPNQSYTTEISYPIKTTGDLQIKATADYKNKITEGSELNNSNTIKFSVGFGL
ncbi:MAG: CARDB domain-containing protein [bacterium]